MFFSIFDYTVGEFKPHEDDKRRKVVEVFRQALQAKARKSDAIQGYVVKKNLVLIFYLYQGVQWLAMGFFQEKNQFIPDFYENFEKIFTFHSGKIYLLHNVVDSLCSCVMR